MDKPIGSGACTRLMLSAALVVLVSNRAGATVADDLCPPLADPCVVSGHVAITGGSTLDFGARTLHVTDDAVVTWSTNVTIIAASCQFDPKSKFAEARTSAADNFLWLQCGSSNLAGKISTVGSGMQLEGDGPHVVSGLIQAIGDEVKPIAIDSYGTPGDVTISGKYNVTSKTGTPPGEFRVVTNFGNVLIAESARIKVRGAIANPFSEFFFIEAGTGTLTIDGQLNLKQKSGAYAVNLEANGDLTFGAKSKLLANAKTTGPEIAINSQGGSVTVFGKIQAQTKDVTLGDGTKINMCASGDVWIKDKALVDGSSGSDGQIILGAGGRSRIGNSPGFGAKVYSKSDGIIELCGDLGAIVSSRSTVVPDPEARGVTGECTSPNSGVLFSLDCNQ